MFTDEGEPFYSTSSDTFVPGEVYVISVSGYSAADDRRGSAEYEFYVNRPPYGGQCDTDRQKGK